MQLAGLHHVTCVCSNAQQTVDFYRGELGFTLVKKTVNFDDPHSYHLYFGDPVGAPGTLLTFFEWPRAEAGRVGRGTLDWLGLATPAVTAETELLDPDGLRLHLEPADAPSLRAVAVVGNPDLYAGLFESDGPLRFGDPLEEPALVGPGTTHHVAWRAVRRRAVAALGSAADRARAAADAGAGPQVLPLGLLPHARRHADRDRDRRARASWSTSRASRSARRSRCRSGSSRSGRHSNGS